jgi:hypothetical protein
MTQRKTLDEMASNDLDQLHDRLERAEETARRALSQRQEMAAQLAEEQRLYRLRTAQWRRVVQARDQRTAAINRVRAVACDAETYEDAADVITAVRAALDQPAPGTRICELPHQTIDEEDACEQRRLTDEPAPGPATTQTTEPCTGQCDPTTGAFTHAVTCYEERERTGRNAGLALPEPAPAPVVLRDPCPRCEDCRLVPRRAMADHMRDVHPEEQPYPPIGLTGNGPG